MRRAKPYWFTFRTNAKQRWIGRELTEVMENEYGGIKGELCLKRRGVETDDWVVRNGDLMEHKVHMHEPVVPRELPTLLVVVNGPPWLHAILKPAGLPLFPVGPFKENTVKSLLLTSGAGSKLPSDCTPVHRLDRVTGGVVLLATSGHTVVLGERVCKEYLALVRVPDALPSWWRAGACIRINAPIQMCKGAVRTAETWVEIVSKKPSSSSLWLLRLQPRTGRTHQLRIHLSQVLGAPIEGDILYGASGPLPVPAGAQAGQTWFCKECNRDIRCCHYADAMGIRLWAWSYASPADGWSVRAPVPEWASEHSIPDLQPDGWVFDHSIDLPLDQPAKEHSYF